MNRLIKNCSGKLCVLCLYSLYSSCNFGRRLSVGAIHVERWNRGRWDSKKGGIGGSGWVSVQSAMYMAAALAGYRKAFVGTGLAISLLFDTNGRRTKTVVCYICNNLCCILQPNNATTLTLCVSHRCSLWSLRQSE